VIRQELQGALGAVVLSIGVVACSVTTGQPSPTPADILGVASVLHEYGITASHFVSGDAGCADRDLTQLAVSIEAVGLDQTTPTLIHVYLFRNGEVYDRLRSAIDTCLESFVTDPSAFGLIEARPYVAAGAGPWAPEFNAALRRALIQAVEQGG